MPSGNGIYRPMCGTVDTGIWDIIACHPESRALESGIRNPAEIDNSKLIHPVVFLRDQVARSPLQFPQERSLVVESR